MSSDVFFLDIFIISDNNSSNQQIQEEIAMLTIKKSIQDNKAVFTLGGRLDTVTAPELEKALNDSLNGITDLTLDCENLEYISSAGLRVLLAAHQKMRSKGEMKLINVNEIVQEVLEVTGLAEILTVE